MNQRKFVELLTLAQWISLTTFGCASSKSVNKFLLMIELNWFGLENLSVIRAVPRRLISPNLQVFHSYCPCGLYGRTWKKGGALKKWEGKLVKIHEPL